MEQDNLLKEVKNETDPLYDPSKNLQNGRVVTMSSESKEKIAEDVEQNGFGSTDEKAQETEKQDDVLRMPYDEAMVKYGTGRYQLFLFILLALVTWSTVFNNNGYIFIGGFQAHTCKLASGSENWTDPATNQTFPILEIADDVYSGGKLVNDSQHWEQCTYSKYVQPSNGSRIRLEKEIKCTSWIYDQSEFELTMSSEWNLNRCHGKWKIAFASSLYMIGFFIGCIVLADLSDRYGRSTILLVSNVCMVLCGVGARFSVNYEMLVVMRLALGIFTAGARNAGFVYVCEIIKHRAAAGMAHGSIYSIGGMAVTAIAQLLPNWRHFQLACALAYILYIPYYWVMPESPRWLLSQGRTKQANEYFKKSARINKVEIPDNLEVYLEYQPKTEGNILTLFRTPNIRKKSLIVCLLWFSVSIVFFGMNYNVGNLSGNIYTNNYLLQVTGIIEVIGLWYIKLGRRPAISSAFLITCAVSAILPLFAEYGIHIAVVAMGMIGKFLIETNFEMIYIVTAELYPTSARVTALGMGSSIARLGGAISPYIALSNDVWPNLPYLIFAAIALVAGLFAIMLPETKHKVLPDSLHQAETENPLSSCTPRCCGIRGDESEPVVEVIGMKLNMLEVNGKLPAPQSSPDDV